MSATAISAHRSGEFATARRGGLTREEMHEIEAHRAKDRPTPWQALAKRYGRPEIALREMFEPQPANDPVAVEEPWPYNPVEPSLEAMVRDLSAHYGMTLASIGDKRPGCRELTVARDAIFASVLDHCPTMTVLGLSLLFERDHATTHKAVKRHRARISKGQAHRFVAEGIDRSDAKHRVSS